MNKAIFVFPFILLSLLAAIWSGWIRTGWSLPLQGTASQHGALMVGSFLSSLIILERAVAFKSKWLLVVPLINALSIMCFLSGNPTHAQAFLIAGSAGFLGICAYFIYKYKEFYYYLFLAGAFYLLIGNIILFKTHFCPSAVTWWMTFFLFTIVAERIELSRFLALTTFKRISIIVILVSVLLSVFIPFHSPGNIFFAISLALTAAWLLKYDMAWYSIKAGGQHRYSALLLITGYVWLLISALLIAFGSNLPFAYDAALHSFFIGFVFSMIFSHAPIIVPAVLKLPIKLYRPLLYVWFALLQITLVMRIVADVNGNSWLRKWAAMGNGTAILIFFITIIVIISGSLKKRN